MRGGGIGGELIYIGMLVACSCLIPALTVSSDCITLHVLLKVSCIQKSRVKYGPWGRRVSGGRASLNTDLTSRWRWHLGVKALDDLGQGNGAAGTHWKCDWFRKLWSREKYVVFAGNRFTIPRLSSRQLSHYTDCAIPTFTCSKHNKRGDVLSNTEPRPCNHCCCGKAVLRMLSVASLRRCACAILSSVTCPSLPYFFNPHCLSNSMIFGEKKGTEQEIWFSL